MTTFISEFGFETDLRRVVAIRGHCFHGSKECYFYWFRFLLIGTLADGREELDLLRLSEFEEGPGHLLDSGAACRG